MTAEAKPAAGLPEPKVYSVSFHPNMDYDDVVLKRDYDALATRLQGEVERLRGEVEIERSCNNRECLPNPFCKHPGYLTHSDDGGKTNFCWQCEKEQAERRAEADKADAGRYRWLRTERDRYQDGKPFIAISHVGGAGYSVWTDEHADRQIDAAKDSHGQS